MPDISIRVRNRIATPLKSDAIVCGNSDYIAAFDFDEEWEDFPVKTARFVFFQNGRPKFHEVVFEGDECTIPVLEDIIEVFIGVYAGDVRTTTPARVNCYRSITDESGPHPAPDPDVYQQILDYLEEIAGGGGFKPDYAAYSLEGGVPNYISGLVGIVTYYLEPLRGLLPPLDWDTGVFYQITNRVLSEVPEGTEYEPNTFFREQITDTNDLTLYHMNLVQTAQVMVNLGGRNYFNTGRGDCYAAVFYDGIYSGPVFFSTDPNAVTYQVDDSASAAAVAFPYQINGQTWYHSETPYWQGYDDRSANRETPRGLLRYPDLYAVSSASQSATEEVLRSMGAIE